MSATKETKTAKHPRDVIATEDYFGVNLSFKLPIVKQGESPAMSLERRTRTLRDLFHTSVQERTLAKYTYHFTKFVEFCTALHVAPIKPGVGNALAESYIDTELLAMFNWHRALEVGSSSSLVSWTSQVFRGAYYRFHILPLPAGHSSRAFLKEINKAISKRIPAVYRPRLALRGNALRALFTKSNYHKPATAINNPNNFTRAVQTLFAYNAALRPNEHCSTDDSGRLVNPALHPAAITFITNEEGVRGVRLEIRRSKAHERSTDPTERVTPHHIFFPARNDELDIAGPLKLYMDISLRDKGSWTQPLFPRLAGSSYTDEFINTREYNAWLRPALISHGLSPTTAQGLRSGRRTDLTEAGVREEIILQLGRWKSPGASRRYYQTSAECMGSLIPADKIIMSKPPTPLQADASPEQETAIVSDEDSSDEDEGGPTSNSRNIICIGSISV